MKKYFPILIFSFIIVLLSGNVVLSQDKYIVSGALQYSGPKTIFVCLYDQNTWPTFKKELAPDSFKIITKGYKSGKTNFTFKQVPKGDYIIVVFIDTNDNGKLDSDTWGFIQEPNEFYKPLDTNDRPNWNNQKFTVDKDINDILIQFK